MRLGWRFYVRGNSPGGVSSSDMVVEAAADGCK